MRSFQATAVIFVIGVLASKVITGCIDTPLYARYNGVVNQGMPYDFHSKKTNVSIRFQLYREWHGGNEMRFIRFEFSGKPEEKAAIGVPEDIVTCEVSDAGRPGKALLANQLNLFYKLTGDDKFCTGLYVGASQGDEYISVLFDGKKGLLSSLVRKAGGRGLIVGMIQSFSYNDWIRQGGV